MSEQKKKIIFDAGAELDDAPALICSCLSGAFDILGITMAWGNGLLDEITEYTRRIVAFSGVRIPVYQGCPGPLVRRIYERDDPLDICKKEYDAAGGQSRILNDFALPKSVPMPERKHAVAFMIDTILSSDAPVTVMATGGLTNLACALQIEPKIIVNIEEIIITGGRVDLANSPVNADDNFRRDPEAAKIVFDSGGNVTLFPHDVTCQAAFTKDDITAIEQIKVPAADLFLHVVKNSGRVRDITLSPQRTDVVPPPGLLCTAYLMNPGVVAEKKRVYASVSLDHGESAGCLLIGMQGNMKDVNTTLACAVDKDLFMNGVLRVFQSSKQDAGI